MAKTPTEDQEVMSEINVTPLVDVMLVLVVIFLVTAPLLTQTVRVNLPKTAATEPNTEKALQIVIDREGKVFLDQRPIADMTQLEAELKLQSHSKAGFQVHADQSVPYAKVAEVMAAAQRAGITKLFFVTVPVNSRG